MRAAGVTKEGGLTPLGPVNLVHLFPELHSELMSLLRGLAPSDWNRPTACPLWSVKDIVAHLLDSCLRRLHPVLDLFVRALPHTYRSVEAKAGTSLTIEVQGEAGGLWTLRREAQGWSIHSGVDPAATCRVTVGQEDAWKLFSKGLSPKRAAQAVRIEGDTNLGRTMLETLAIMA